MRVRPSLLCLALAPFLSAQEGVPAPDGLVPEQMWYAPTAADWAKPVAIRWQRTWDDAVRLSQQTQKPILVCVNMDGEIASEHYAGVRYRDPELAKLWEPYVCVIASVYRHTPRDYDEQGRRIPCPRLGGVTCGEHIALEPLVFAKFLDGKRISPRHIMVELDGSEVYDVFYTWDTQSVFDTLRDGIKNRKLQAPPVVKGDRSLREKLESPDSEDREAIEQLFGTADPAQRAELLQLALARGEQVPVELLRLSAYGLDPDLAAKARQGMAQASDPGAVDLIADTLKLPMLAAERQALAQALRRFGATNAKAQGLAAAHSGLAGQSGALDTKGWSAALAGQDYAAAAAANPIGIAEASDRSLREQPRDPAALLAVAEANLLQALDLDAGSGRGATRAVRRQFQLLLDDAASKAKAAADAGATGWRALAVQAVIAKHQRERDRAYELAIQAAPQLPPNAPGLLAVEVLGLFAAARQHAIVQKAQQKEDWDPAWMADVHTTYSLLGQHPLGRDQHAVDHYDFLQFFGAPDTELILQRGLARFPASAALHQRWRDLLLGRDGPDGLEADYTQRLAVEGVDPALRWFAGYASLCAAEHHRNHQQPEPAAAAYKRAIAHYRGYRETTERDDGQHYLAMAHGGLARLYFQADDLAGTFVALEQVFQIAPAAAAAVDGLGITAMQTAEMLRGRALSQQNEALVGQVDRALAALPPEAFELPEYERASRGNQPRRRRQ
jgi:hypothetical protein